MNYEKLFAMQKALDHHIESNHGLIKEELIEKKILALLVELGELANETRCFKFWSIKEASSKGVILEEFVDGIHFILSLGITKSYESHVPDQAEIKPLTEDLTEQFIIVYGKIHAFHKEKNELSFKEMFREYLNLGVLLGFSTEEIEKSYIDKNEVNYQRQQQGY